MKSSDQLDQLNQLDELKTSVVKDFRRFQANSSVLTIFVSFVSLNERAKELQIRNKLVTLESGDILKTFCILTKLVNVWIRHLQAMLLWLRCSFD